MSNSVEKTLQLLNSLLFYIVGSLFSIGLFIFIVAIIIIVFFGSASEPTVIDADDVGRGVILDLPVTLTDPIESSLEGQATQAWSDTGLLLSKKDNQIAIGLSLGNPWFPLGKNNKDLECKLESCSQSSDPRCQLIGLKDSGVSVVSSEDSNKGCKLTNGKGIYLLFAKPLGNGNYNNPNEGLLLYLDSTKLSSYNGSGDTWNDISGFENNATLVNSPTFNANNGGSIVFNDDLLQYGTVPNIGDQNTWTVEIWFKIGI
jgi:hypothetical protein